MLGFGEWEANFMLTVNDVHIFASLVFFFFETAGAPFDPMHPVPTPLHFQTSPLLPFSVLAVSAVKGGRARLFVY